MTNKSKKKASSREHSFYPTLKESPGSFKENAQLLVNNSKTHKKIRHHE